MQAEGMLQGMKETALNPQSLNQWGCAGRPEPTPCESRKENDAGQQVCFRVLGSAVQAPATTQQAPGDSAPEEGTEGTGGAEGTAGCHICAADFAWRLSR